MKKINLIYADDCCDADILLVPDSLYETGGRWCPLYSEWLTQQGRIDMESEGFVAWLNEHFCKGEEKAEILAQHVTVSENEPRIDF